MKPCGAPAIDASENFFIAPLKPESVLIIHSASSWRWLPRCLLGLGIETGTGRVRCLIPILLFGGFGYAHL
jgi:hypothetical protein